MINKERLQEWLDRIYETAEEDISCRELMDQLPTHIDAIIQGDSTNGKYANLDKHLDVCPDCSEVYDELVHLAALEEDGRLPEVVELLADLAGEETAVPTD